MMKYTVRPLYIREAIIFGNLQNYKTVKWDEIHHGNESDGKETLGDSLTKDSLWCKDFDFPKLPVFKCLVCSNDLYEDYCNFKDFEEVDDFLANNDSDWQEGGLYNAAHIVKQDKDFNIIEEMFYSVATHAIVEMKICSGHYYHLTEAHTRLYEQKRFNPKRVVFYKQEVMKYSF